MEEGGEEKIRYEGDRIVAMYVGRQTDRNKTNELGSMLIEKYNAFAVIENNLDNFIRHMIQKSRQKWMALKSDLPFLKELNTNLTSYHEYGVTTNTTMWRHYINKITEYLKEEIGKEHMSNGKPLRTIYGVEKIPDIGLIKELLAFTDEKGNYDRVISFGLVLSLAKARQANRLVTRVNEKKKSEEEDKNLYKVQRSPFSARAGRNRTFTRSPFRNVK